MARTPLTGAARREVAIAALNDKAREKMRERPAQIDEIETLLRAMAILRQRPQPVLAPVCSSCGGSGLVDWMPGQHRTSEDDQQPCPDCNHPTYFRGA